MLLGAAHAGGEVLEAVHVESAAAITRWYDALTLGQTLHFVHHFRLVGATVVLFRLLAGTLAGGWQEIRGRARYWNRRVHHRVQFSVIESVRWSCSVKR